MLAGNPRDDNSLPLPPVHVYIDPNVPPRHLRSRCLPLTVDPKVRKELFDLVEEGVLVGVGQSRWASPLVVVVKGSGELRLCGDYKSTVNKHIHYNHYCLPLIENLLAKLSSSKIFSSLDLHKAYHQVPLDSESRPLTTITTPYGLFEYVTLPFGFSCAPSIFQGIMD